MRAGGRYCFINSLQNAKLAMQNLNFKMLNGKFKINQLFFWSIALCLVIAFTACSISHKVAHNELTKRNIEYSEETFVKCALAGN
ncbi:MAG: hypothetical protein QME64_12150, partial [bacterium]|nr:hypothetical protein [bacterium]